MNILLSGMGGGVHQSLGAGLSCRSETEYSASKKFFYQVSLLARLTGSVTPPYTCRRAKEPDRTPVTDLQNQRIIPQHIQRQ
jgi:hypothetical protein